MGFYFSIGLTISGDVSFSFGPPFFGHAYRFASLSCLRQENDHIIYAEDFFDKTTFAAIKVRRQPWGFGTHPFLATRVVGIVFFVCLFWSV